MVLNLERQIVAALLQYPDLISKLKRAKIEPSDIEDVPAKIVLKAILKASELGEVTPQTVETIIQDDKQLKTQDKQLYCQVVEDLSGAEVDNTEFTFSYFAERKAESDLRKAMSMAATSLHQREEIAQIKQRLLDSLSKMEISDLQINRYEDGLSARERERNDIKKGDGMMKFTDELRHLSDYFPFGLLRETMTCIQGSTNAGKSIFLANLIWHATKPQNKLNVLYVFSENRAVEALSRLDAVVLGKPYRELYNGYLSRDERSIIVDREKNGCGKIIYCKPEFENFSVSTIEEALELAAQDNILIDMIAIDSPDHMIPTRRTNQYFQDKPQVWKDLKALMHKHKIAIVGTWPLREEYSGYGKGDKEPPALTANSGAGGQDVARPMDNIIAFSYDEKADDLMAHRNFVVTKCRDGKRDFSKMRYRILDNLRFIHADDFNEQFKPKDLDEAFAPSAY